MKIIIFILVMSIAAPSWAEVQVDLKYLTKRTAENNLAILENAEKVYQAKLSIEQARLSLLPSLNVWKLGKLVVDPTSFLDMADEIVPFLAPANWFRVNQTEKLYESEKFGFVALKANQVYQARDLYFKINFDMKLLSGLVKIEEELQEIYSIAEDRFDLGLEKVEFLREVKIQLLSIQEDISKLMKLIEVEKISLKSFLGIPTEEKINIVFDDQIIDWKEINLSNELEKVISKSPEIKQLDKLIEVLPSIKSEYRFSILGAPTITRGTAGGVFDDLPEGRGLGFSTGKQLELVKSKENVLILQRKGIEDLFSRNLKTIELSFNSTVSLLKNQSERLTLSSQNLETYKEKIAIGGGYLLADLIISLNGHIQILALRENTQNELYAQKDRIERLSFTGDYAFILDTESIQRPEENRNCKKTIFRKVRCK